MNNASPEFLDQWKVPDDVAGLSSRILTFDAISLPATADAAVLAGSAGVGLAIADAEKFGSALRVQKNAVAFTSDSRTQVTVDRGLGYIGMATIIGANEGAERFSYELISDIATTVELGDAGGALFIQSDAVVGSILPPWATDANGNDVPTWYEIDGNQIVQVVDHLGAGYTYPIVADPTYAGEVLIDWVTATSSPWETHVFTSGWWATNIIAGNLSVRLFVTDEYARSVPAAYDTSGAREQVSCHAFWAPLKHPWNIELWRPTVGEAATAAAACNP